MGELDIRDAQRIATERGLDLVEVAPQAQPPVCKLLNYGAFQYQQEKAERKQKAKQKRIEVKGIRISFKIGEHDLAVRREQSRKFLADGHKVRVEMLFRGRENAYRQRGEMLVRKFIESLGPVIIEQSISYLGNKMSMTVGAKGDFKRYAQTQDAPGDRKTSHPDETR